MALDLHQSYRDCYAACRAEGGTIQACTERCQGLMPDAGECDPCCGLWNCFVEELPRTVTDVAGGVHEYVLQPVQRLGTAVLIGVVAVLVLIAVLR